MSLVISGLLCALVAQLGAEKVEHTLGGLSGVIQTPNFPATYPDDLNITWNIKVRPGFLVSLYFTEFDLEDSYDEDQGGACAYDYLKIEENGKMIHKFCGNPTNYPMDAPRIRSEIKSESNVITLHFATDYSNEDPLPTGFKAHYKEIDRDECAELERKAYSTFEDWDLLLYCNHHCNNVPGTYYCSCDPGFYLHENKHTCTHDCRGKVLTAPTGEIQTSRYPQQYSKLANCDWTIKSKEGINIELKFMDQFEIEEHEDEGCVYDWVQYTDAEGVKSERYCGIVKPNQGKWIFTHSHMVTVTFQSDLTIEKAGLKLIYRTNRVRCKRVLQTPQNGQIKTKLKKFVFEDFVDFECNIGYRLIGDARLTCQSSGEWSADEPVCEIKRCKHPAFLDKVINGRIKEEDIQLTYGSNVTVLCFVWYEMTSGTSVWGCGDDEQWHEVSNAVAPNTNNNLPECEPICGLKGNSKILAGTYDFGDVVPQVEDKEEFVGPQIVAGKKSKEAEWPWMAFVDLFGQGVISPSDFCGGTVVSPRVVITAAHCTTRTYKDQIRVYVGLNNRLEVNKAELQTFSVEDVYQHIGFNNATEYSNDIAVLRLNASIRIGKFVRPICIPRSEREKSLPESALKQRDNFAASGIIAGWGVTEIGTTSWALMEARVPPIEHEICKKNVDLSESYNVAITDRMLCAGSVDGGRDSCQGDSGGPYMFRDNTRGKWYLSGIVSFGSSERDCGDKTFGIYTNVASYIAWIESFLQN